jgi:hypothetical protein
MNFYFAHNPNQYGWHEDVPWPREDDVTANRVGWELGFEHLRDEPLSVLESTRDGTFALYGSPEYALFWSSQVPNPGGHPDFTPRFVKFEGVVGRVLVTGAALLLSLAAVSVLGWRAWTRPMRVVVATLLACNWLGYAVVFFGHPRFRYTAEMFMAILAAFTIVTLRRATRGPPEAPAE